MPGPAISQYLDNDTYEAFKEISSVFRHDFAQYMGMLHSWMTLIQVEIEEIDEAACPDVTQLQTFYKQTNELCAFVESAFQETTARLHPQVPQLETENHKEITIHLQKAWDKYYGDFTETSRPQLQSLHERMQAFTESGGFKDLIEKRLGEAAGEPVHNLILRPFDKMLSILNPENFDSRIADVVTSRNGNQTLGS